MVTGWINRVWLLVVGFPPRRPGFNLRSDHQEFVVDKVALHSFSPSTLASLPSSHSTNCSAFLGHLIMQHYLFSTNSCMLYLRCHVWVQENKFLADCTSAGGWEHVEVNRLTPCALALNCNSFCITAELFNVVSHPPQCCHLVLHCVITWCHVVSSA